MTAPITPDERAAMRALADAATEGPWEAHEGTVGAMTGPRDCGGCSGLVSPRHEPACFWSEVAGAAPADAEFIAAARTAVPRLLDALDTAEAARDEARAEAAVARQHQREASLTIRSVEGLRKERDDALAEVARLLAERTAAHADDATRASCTHEYVADMERRVEEAEAEVERLSEAAREFEDYEDNLAAQVLAARQGQDKAWRKARRRKAERDEARAEVKRLRATVSHAWDEDTVRAEVDREALRRFVDSFCDDEAGEVEHVMSADGTSGFALTGGNDAHAVLRKAASALRPGESRAQVEATALRDWIGEWPTSPDDGTFLADVARDGLARADRIEKGETP